MPTENRDQRLEQAKKDTLVASNAQAIAENLRNLKAFPEIHRRRWIWELLQNAADAIDAEKGKSKVFIRADADKLCFSHNGAPFNTEEISHLIYHGSTKQEDETKKGKFGSGFLTVHLIAFKVRIHGVLEDQGIRECFDFSLDRSGDTSREIQQNMEVAWTSFKDSLRDATGESDLTTTYECVLDPAAARVVESGLNDLTGTVPYVLGLVDEISEVTVAKSTGTTCWRRVEQKSVGNLSLTDVICTRTGGYSETFRVALVGDYVKSIGLAVLLRQTGDHWEVVNESATPRLFYPLPLVETHDLGVPFALVSQGFEPTEQRNGILAGKAGDSDRPTAKNWALLNEVPALFETLVEACVLEHWTKPQHLARFSQTPGKSWIDADRFGSQVLRKAIDFLRGNAGPAIVLAKSDKYLSPAKAVIPVNDSEGNLYDLAEMLGYVQDNLPLRQVVGDWGSILDGWSSILAKGVEQLDEALTVDKLAGQIAHCHSLDQLKTALNNSDALVWLNGLLGLVSAPNLQSFVRQRALLPSQLGHLKKDSELRLDGGIDEAIKTVCEKLDVSVRSQLLLPGVCPAVRQLFEGAAGRVLSNEECVETALKRLKEPTADGKEEAYQQANAELLCWLIQHKRKEKLTGFTVLCVSGRHDLRAESPLLEPVELWDEGAKAFADVFPETRRLDGHYTASLQTEHWRYLEECSLVLASMFVTEQLDTFDQRQVDDILSEEMEHKPAVPAAIPQIVFLRGEGGVLDGLRKSRPKAKRFLQFLLQYVIKADHTWNPPSNVVCSCGSSHRVFPGWVFQVKTREWVPLAQGKGDRPTAENISKLLDDGLKHAILNDTDCAQFLLKIGIGVSELVRIGVPEEKRFQLDQLSARIYASADESTLESIEAVLADPDLKESVLAKKHEKERVARNQKAGRLVEDLLRDELKSADIQVIRTGVGSDFAVGTDFENEFDFVENGQEQFLAVSQYLLEIKSTSVPFARMTLRQGEEAVKPENLERFVLCVVDVASGEVNQELIRDKAKFVFGIGVLAEATVTKAKGFKGLEDVLSQNGGGAVEIDIVKGSVKIRIGSQIWVQQGISLQEFIDLVKNGPKQS